ncbi:MAG TPA: VOC family protein [Trueperaceae bacterium]|nr:VOC family protein [Trueperaceae bacterium]
MELDHLLYVGPDLARLVRDLTDLSGLTASVGGKHPGQGTHNALLGLGPDSYLELMAPDPEQSAAPGASAPGAAPPGTFLRSIAYAATPQVFTWCAKARDAGATASAARALGLEVTVYGGSRVTPAGATLRWDLIIVDGHGLGGVVPFLIDWHDSPHPARALHERAAGANGLRLDRLELRHPDPAAVTNLLRGLSTAGGAPANRPLEVAVRHAPQPGIVAKLTGPAGPFELSGRGGQLVTRGS